MKPFRHADVETETRSYWGRSKVYAHIKERNQTGVPFAFIDGPPYTSGKVHLGTAWNKSLKDMVLRVKRMQGYNVYDRAGYDMHGLPTEHATMKKLGLHTTEDILNYGVDKFIEACREWCTGNLAEMNKEFEKLGVWMDFENAYQTISPEYINGIWTLLHTAYEKGRLYEGLRTMAWDPVFQTACAKHELVYETVTDQSIYVKFKIEGTTNDYLIIWTTTPWTIPLNMAVMVNPELEYIKARVGSEHWIVAKERADAFIKDIATEDYSVLDTFSGSALAGTRYIHPLHNIMHYDELKQAHPNVHTVVLTKEYVDASAGTGLVHSAPGCGPEDYEVGVANNLPVYNPVLPDGTFPQPFLGWRARTDDKKFVELLDEHSALVAKQHYKHEYPHSERSKAPVIYRATKQWFFKVNDLKERMVEANNNVEWQPEAGFNAFNSWLENLRDNSITKQRYWGTPIPIWKNDETGEVLLIKSVHELEQLTGRELRTVMSLHKPAIDELTIKSTKHPGTILKRIPDVLDVWVDAGSASWNTLNYPQNKELIRTNFPGDFILEGKDQIRGWFNLLMITGFLLFDQASFKRVYMHGYINDSQGRKMSKSLGNYITPDEVLPAYGVDAFRMYVIGGTAPGLDLNYNLEDLSTTHKNLNVLWNTVQYLVDLCVNNEIIPEIISDGDEEELYLLSRMESTTQQVNEAMAEYNLPRVPKLVEEFFLEISRTYIQMTREKSSGDEKQLVANALYSALQRALTLLAPVAPFITEALWQDLNQLTSARGSVHEQPWPQTNKQAIRHDIEDSFATVQQIITAGLSAREQLKQGVRWPLSELVINTQLPLRQYDGLIKRQVNVKKVTWGTVSGKVDIQPNYGALGKSFGKETQKIAKLIVAMQPRPPVTIEGYSLLPEHVVIKEFAPEGYAAATFSAGTVYLQSALTPDLLEEGFVRELTRRVQALRKDLGLQKRDMIDLHISGAHSISSNHLDELARKCNASLVDKHFSERRDEHIRERTYTISAQKTI